MLETYLQMQAQGGEAEAASAPDELPMPTRAEDVDKFMRELAEAAAGGTLPPADEPPGRMTSITTI